MHCAPLFRTACWPVPPFASAVFCISFSHFRRCSPYHFPLPQTHWRSHRDLLPLWYSERFTLTTTCHGVPSINILLLKWIDALLKTDIIRNNTVLGVHPNRYLFTYTKGDFSAAARYMRLHHRSNL